MLGSALISGVLGLALLQATEEQRPPTAFPVVVWRSQFPGKALPPELVRDFGGVNVEGPDSAQWALANGLDFYVGHAPGRNDLHIDSDRDWYAACWQEYWDSRDPQGLVRVPCLSEEQALSSLQAQLTRTAQARAGRHGLGLSLGDEIGLTPWGAPLDLCGSTACRAAFREFLASHETWGDLLPDATTALPFPDTDSTRLAWIDGDPRHVQAWLARREFHHQVVIDTLEALTATAHKLAPGTPVGLFGQSGRTAFGDVGVEQVLPFLDFLEVYRLRDSRELLYTLRAPHQKSYLTVFPDEEAPHGPAWVAWEHWLRGGDGLVLWSDQELLAKPEYHARMARAVRDIRRADALCPEWAPAPVGVAVIHSPDALALSWLRDALQDGPTWMRRFASYQTEHGTREVLLRAMLRLLEDCGQRPGSLPLAEIDGATKERFNMLVAAELLLVSEAEEHALRAHLSGGGRLLVSGAFGTYDRHGAKLERDLFAQLRADHGSQIQRFELDPARYLAERQLARQAYADERRARISPVLPELDEPAWVLSVKGDASPWLRAQQRAQEGGGWLCAALPNAQEAEQRQDLKPLQVQVELPQGMQLEWIHPPAPDESRHQPSCLLPAGDALVFRLYPASQD